MTKQQEEFTEIKEQWVAWCIYIGIPHRVLFPLYTTAQGPGWESSNICEILDGHL